MELIRQNAEIRMQMAQLVEQSLASGWFAPVQNPGMDSMLMLAQQQGMGWQQHQPTPFSPKALSRKGRKSEFSPGHTKATAHPEAQTDTASTCATSTCGYSSDDADETFVDQRRTTVMMRNIPTSYTRANLVELLDQQGFQGTYDFVYLPVKIQTALSHGFAFINFTTTESTERFWQHFTGFSDWIVPSAKVCEVTWSETAQGIDEQIERYRDSPMMHESVDDKFRPALFKDGQRIPFPAPTTKIKAPRHKRPLLPKAD
jgi:hypothetical protein